ncbi:MAG TPA: cysteine desulfurase family protein [Acidimicrobiales bacterium]|nr:cysteine desulfurase family protein [Acidimicrobiales bacterium]
MRSYLDHASTSPLRPEARDAIVAWLDAGVAGGAGDPGRIHAEGLTARVAVEEARAQVAGLLGARAREVVLTSGATEAIAAACWGAASRGSHQVVPAIEHSAVRLAAGRHGEVTVVPVDRLGRVAVEDLAAAVRPGETALVHLQWGNHEVGTTQPVAEAVAACRELGVLVHVDAAQAVGHVPVAFRDLGADLLSVSAHKLGGPPGVGALLVRQGLRLPPLLVGGDQERARRAGLENVPGAAGFGAACAALAARDRLAAEAADQRRLTERILAALGGDGLDGLVVYGDPDGRLPHVVCLGVEGIEPQAVLLGLDRAGIAAHSGSACSSESLEPSPVLEAMGVDAHHSLRLSAGWSTTDADVDRLLDALPRVLADLRALGR